MLGMQPIFYERLTGEGLRLRDFVLMMREGEINAAGVNVKRLAQVFHGHDGALDMPAGAAFAHRSRPSGLVILARFPQNEVACVVFVVLIDIDASASPRAAEIVM